MRILIVCPQEEDVGGVQNVIGNLTRYLTQHGHEVLYFHAGSSTWVQTKKSSQGIPTYDLNLQLPFGERSWTISLPLFLIRFPIALFQLIRIIRKNRIQVVNVHYPAVTGCYFAFCRRMLPIRLVTSVHGADLFPGGKPLTEYPRALRLLLNESDRLTAPSRSFRDDVVRVFPSLD